MKTRVPIVDDNLARVDLGWRWLRLLQHSGMLGTILALFFLLLALAIRADWLTDPALAKALVGLACASAFISWFSVAVAIFGKTLEPDWLARMVERGQPKLLDRVNTLVALEKRRAQPEVAPFYRRIGQQAQALLTREPPASALSARRPLLHLFIFFVALLATVQVYHKLAPWERLSARAKQQVAAQPAPAEPTLELPPAETVIEQKQPWLEVRITDPARDLEVTKVDVVPLQIEAAANEPLHKVGWISALNGLAEQTHELPPPADPRYAIYQPLLYLDEFSLSDWDVLAYYAQANTQTTNSAASDVYFLQVRPFREDILKMPGGENGLAMQCINQLSALIRQQQHVIRQTHQHRQTPPPDPKLEEQDRRKLADAEADLSQATAHLYAQMTADLEGKPIGEALDHLAKAEKTLDQAAFSMRDNLLDPAQTQERSALADLVAARKAFPKTVSENSKQFTETSPEEIPPLAEPKDILSQIAEFRDEGKAAQDFLENLLRKQNALANQVSTNSVTRFPNLAGEEREIQQALEEFMQQHPRVFRPAQPEAEAARQNLQSATQLLENKNPQAKPQTREAANQMQKLAQAMQERSQERQLADAYKLKQMLDRQIEKSGQCQNAAPADGPSNAEMQTTVAETRQTLKQLKQVAEQPPTRDEFGPALRESLSDLKMLSLHWPLSELDRPLSPDAKQKVAGQVKEGLQEVSQAFEKSQPQALQARQANPQPGESQGDWERGLAQLESLIRQLEREQPPSRDDQHKQGKEALHHLQSAWNEKGAGNEQNDLLLARLEQALKPGEETLDVGLLKQLKEALQTALAEILVPREEKKPDQPDVTALDPNRLPPAYRKQIEKYFQKLSEK
jgi:hypothetical protein